MDLSYSRAESLLLRGLALFETHLPRLDEYAATWPPEEQLIRSRDKLAVEAALMILVVSRLRDRVPSVRRTLDRLAAIVEPHVRGPRLRSLLLSTPSVAVTLGAGHVYLQAAGYLNPEVESLFDRCLGLDAPRMVERVPYRAMDVRWMLGLREGAAVPAFDDLIPLSILGGSACSFSMSAQDAYAFTHATMYLTDFGRRALPDSVPPVRVSSLLEGGIGSSLLEEDYDLLIEMLIVAACSGEPWPPHAHVAWEAVVGIWDRLGFLPAPGLNRAEHEAVAPEQAASLAFRDLYHTNLVGVILCAMMVLAPPRDGSPVSEIAPAPIARTIASLVDLGALERASSRARAILAQGHIKWSPRQPAGSSSPLDTALARCLALRLPGPADRAPWLSAARHSTLDDSSLARVFFDAAIVHAARTGDLVNLAHALRESRAAHLGAHGPTWSDGLRYLVHNLGPSDLFGVADERPADPVASAAATLEIVACLSDLSSVTPR
ncbi:MAG: DUF6895 family protein [Phycisphaerales bacterium]